MIALVSLLVVIALSLLVTRIAAVARQAASRTVGVPRRSTVNTSPRSDPLPFTCGNLLPGLAIALVGGILPAVTNCFVIIIGRRAG